MRRVLLQNLTAISLQNETECRKYRIPALSLRSPHLTLQLSYQEYGYLKQTLENYRFCRNSGNDTYGRGGSSSLRHHDALRTTVDM